MPEGKESQTEGNKAFPSTHSYRTRPSCSFCLLCTCCLLVLQEETHNSLRNFSAADIVSDNSLSVSL